MTKDFEAFFYWNPVNYKNRHIDADPYPWPYNGDLRPENVDHRHAVRFLR
jgi:hypothetical protein